MIAVLVVAAGDLVPLAAVFFLATMVLVDLESVVFPAPVVFFELAAVLVNSGTYFPSPLGFRQRRILIN